MSDAPPEAAQAQEPPDRLEAVVAVLIALATVIGALVAWRASVADDGAGDADFAGLHAAAAYQEALALSRVNGYEHYAVFIDYYRSDRLSDGLDLLASKARGARAEGLEVQAREAADLATSSLTLLSDLGAARYLNRDGTFALDRDLGAMMAEAAKAKDLDFQRQFQEADQLRAKSSHLLMSIVVLSLSLVFFTLVETFEGRLRFSMAGLGTLLLLTGSVMGYLAEMGG